MALAYIHESVSDRGTKNFDWWGAASLGTALAFLVMILDQGTDWGWTSVTALLSYAIIIISATVFYFIEKNHPEPIVDFSFFKNRTFNAALINNFIIFLGMMGSVFAIPIFAQTFLGMDATQSGMLFIPMGFCMLFAAIVLGRFTAKLSAKTAIFISTAGCAAAFYYLSYIDPRSTAIDIIIPLVIMALFMGSAMAQRTSIIASSVPRSEIGVASSVLALVRNIGGAFGIAIFGTLLNSLTESNALALAKNSIINAVTPAQHATAVALIELKAQVMAYSQIDVFAAIIVLIGAFAVFLMKTPQKTVVLSQEEMAMSEV
jgi:predicted MFS family arabinose efflux permease